MFNLCVRVCLICVCVCMLNLFVCMFMTQAETEIEQVVLHSVLVRFGVLQVLCYFSKGTFAVVTIRTTNRLILLCINYTHMNPRVRMEMA